MPRRAEPEPSRPADVTCLCSGAGYRCRVSRFGDRDGYQPNCRIGRVCRRASPVPFATATAQYYPPPPCSPFPLFWPLCVAGAVVGTAAAKRRRTVLGACALLLRMGPPGPRQVPFSRRRFDGPVSRQGPRPVFASVNYLTLVDRILNDAARG